MLTVSVRYKAKALPKRSHQFDADCILLQETKAQGDQIDKALEGINGYHIYSNCAERKGYWHRTESGLALLESV